MTHKWLAGLLEAGVSLQEGREEEIERMRRAPGVIIFGAGATADHTLKVIQGYGLRVLQFCDNDRKKWGCAVSAGNTTVRIGSIEEISPQSGLFIYISSQMYYREIYAQLMGLGFSPAAVSQYDHVIQLPWEQNAHAVLSGQRQELERFHALLWDDVSRDVLERRCAFLLSRKRDYLTAIHQKSQYFCYDIVNSGGEIFADVGTFTGDTIEGYIAFSNNSYKHIYGFEPCDVLYRKAAACFAQNAKVTIIQKGTSNFDGFEKVSSALGLMMSSEYQMFMDAEEKSAVFPVCRLDSFFRAEKCLPTFIKMDIEGGEKKSLEGAEAIIREGKPKLAIAVYHLADDILKLSSMIQTYNKDYKFFLRHYSDNSTETVLYAV